MKNKLNKNLNSLLLPLLLLSSLNAATYTDNYRVTDLNKTMKSNDNMFMNEDFKEIIRYDMICFDGDTVDENSKKILDEARDKIQMLTKENRDFKITLVGHTDRFTDDENEVAIDSKTYANAIQNWFRDSLDTNESMELSKSYAQDINKSLVDQNISQDLIFLEYRGGYDEAYTQTTSEGKELSNGVLLSIYVNNPKDIDSDRDGVFDRFDRCPETPRGSKVDKNGCPIDSDKDGVLDYKDECPKTPIGVKVDVKGCPLDSDGDGVVDYKDKCANTPVGVKIDPFGCSIKSTLKLNFATDSAKILKQSYPEVKAFADFLKKNPAYSVTITGHTDSVGKATSNIKLSQRRAAMTKKALVAEGVEASRLVTKGRGELDPIASNRTKSGRELNRRIEVELSLVKN